MLLLDASAGIHFVNGTSQPVLRRFAAEQHGLLRADLQRAGTPFGGNDLMISAIARAHDLTAVTHNLGEFSRVVGLRVVDWQDD